MRQLQRKGRSVDGTLPPETEQGWSWLCPPLLLLQRVHDVTRRTDLGAVQVHRVRHRKRFVDVGVLRDKSLHGGRITEPGQPKLVWPGSRWFVFCHDQR